MKINKIEQWNYRKLKKIKVTKTNILKTKNN